MFDTRLHVMARFWSSIEVRGKNQCWPWRLKAKNEGGYGLFTFATGKSGGLKVVASRIACFLEHGPAPKDKPHALHECDNPPRCNPAHLRWGSPKENRKDSKDRGRDSPPPRNAAYRRRDTQPKGAIVWNQSLTEATVREIWALQIAGGRTVTEIAKIVGVKKHAVHDVTRGRSWRHLPGAPTIEQLKAGGVRRGFNQFS